MKRVFVVVFSLFAFSVQLNAQPEKSGAIQFETTFDPAAMAVANGIKLSDDATARMPKRSVTNFELLFNSTQASYMQVEEMDDSNSSGNNAPDGGSRRFSGLGVFGGGTNREYYYNFIHHRLIQAFELNDTTFLMENQLGTMPVMGGGMLTAPIIEYIKSDEVKKILGFTCHKVIAKITIKRKIQGVEREITDQTSLWYTDELGFDFSPNPVLWTEGAVLAIEGKGINALAKSIAYRNVSVKDLSLPKNGIEISQEQLRAKMDLRRKRTRLNNHSFWN